MADLKASHWSYSKDSQIDWFHANVSANDRHILVQHGRDLVGYMHLAQRIATADGRPSHIVGLSSVVVSPTFRRMRIGAQMVAAASAEIAAAGTCCWGLLQCSLPLVGFYAHHNWSVFTGSVRCRDKSVEQPFVRDDCAMVFPEARLAGVLALVVDGKSF